MSGQAKLKQTKATGKRVANHQRKMTDTESTDLLESASQALAMVQGSKLIAGRLNVRAVPTESGELSNKGEPVA